MTIIAVTSDLHYGFGNQKKSHKIISDFLVELSKDIPDILIIAGDIISHSQDQWHDALGLLREIFPEIPILVVLGNHDFWHTYRYPWSQLNMSIRRKLKEHDIQHLPGNPYKTKELHVFGLDGWYGSSHPPSNDLYYMPKHIGDIPTHDHLFMKARYDFDAIPKKDRRFKAKRILVTHFEPSDDSMGGPPWMDKFSNKLDMDIVICGHTHKSRFDKVKAWNKDKTDAIDKTIILNPGSDYNFPKKYIIDTSPENSNRGWHISKDWSRGID